MKRLWFGLLVFTMGTNLSVPLFPIYQAKFHMTSAGITLLFAVYAVALLPSLLIIGPLSDQVGRKIILIPSMILMVLASVTFAAAGNLSALFMGRALQGIATGAFLGTCTAAFVDHAGTRRTQTLQLASFTTMIGFGLGPGAAGLLLQWTSWHPLQMPYWVHILLMFISIVGVWTTRDSRPSRKRVRLAIRIGIPRSVRPAFLRVVGPAGVVFFAFNGTVISLIPSFSAQILHVTNHVVAGGLIFLMMLSGGIAQFIKPDAHPISVTRLGLILTVAGAFFIILSGASNAPYLMLLATVVEGVGNGLAFKGGLGLAGTLGAAETRAQVVSSYYVAAYTGFSVPVFLGGVLSKCLGMIHGLLVLSIVLGIWAGIVLLNRPSLATEMSSDGSMHSA